MSKNTKVRGYTKGAAIAVLLFALVATAEARMSTGQDGFFQPSADITLALPADGVFNFSGVRIDPGITVRFAGDARAISLLALEDVMVGGWIDTGSRDLTISTSAQITITGRITSAAGTLNISADLTASFLSGTQGVSTAALIALADDASQASNLLPPYPYASVGGLFAAGPGGRTASLVYQLNGPLLPPLGFGAAALSRESGPLSAIPEPATYVLMLSGLVLLLSRAGRRSISLGGVPPGLE